MCLAFEPSRRPSQLPLGLGHTTRSAGSMAGRSCLREVPRASGAWPVRAGANVRRAEAGLRPAVDAAPVLHLLVLPRATDVGRAPDAPRAAGGRQPRAAEVSILAPCVLGSLRSARSGLRSAPVISLTEGSDLRAGTAERPRPASSAPWAASSTCSSRATAGCVRASGLSSLLSAPFGTLPELCLHGGP